jgi:hypothetical protein
MFDLSSTSNFTINAFIHIALIFSFLTFLFTFIIAPLSKNAFNSNMDKLIQQQIDLAIPNQIDLTNETNLVNNRKQLVDQLTQYINDYFLIQNEDPTKANEIINNISNIIDYIVKNNFFYDQLINTYNEPNFIISTSNKSILNISIYLSITLVIISIVFIIIYKMSCSSCIDLSTILIENFFIFTIVGAAEYWFFINYAFNYHPVPPSLLINTSIQNIKNLL